MTTAHLHLLLNHFPILGSIFLTVLFIIALLYRNTFLQKVTLWFLVGIAILTAVTNATGDGAAKAVQNLPGVSHEMIRSHEQFAKIGLALMFVTGVIALGTALFYSYKPSIPRILLGIILATLLLNSGVFAYVGFLGGQIHHEEIRTTTSVPLLLKQQITRNASEHLY